MFEDKVLKCRDCGVDFEFTAREQEFYAEKGFQNEPGRCPSCRSAVNNAATSAAETKAANARCIPQFAPSAAVKLRFLSPRVATVRFIAGTASRRLVVSAAKS